MGELIGDGGGSLAWDAGRSGVCRGEELPVGVVNNETGHDYTLSPQEAVKTDCFPEVLGITEARLRENICFRADDDV